MPLISQDQYVCLEYRLRLESGEWIRGSAAAPEKLCFIAGVGEVLPGLERRLWGLKENDQMEFVIPAEEGFGLPDPANIQVWSHKVFPPGVKPYAGMQVLPANLPFPAEFPARVKEVSKDQVVLDLNHPLAGQDLYYEVRVLEVRPATPEELEPAKQCKECREV
ncbi:MAG: peptidylprolyl isomerase [Deltaproteobacteria bacterium]|nr:peptidylprolyl isomerase [Deltaproteobacteria bacterium]